MNASGEVGYKESQQQYRHPNIKRFPVAQGIIIAEAFCNRTMPDLGAIATRHAHQQASQKQSFCRTIEVTQVKRVGMVCFPGREKHRQARYKRGECANLCMSQTNSSGFAQACQRTVERIDAVADSRPISGDVNLESMGAYLLEQLPKAAGSSSSPCLLAVDIIQGLIAVRHVISGPRNGENRLSRSDTIKFSPTRTALKQSYSKARPDPFKFPFGARLIQILMMSDINSGRRVACLLPDRSSLA